MFNSQGAAVRAAYTEVTGQEFTGPIKEIEQEVRAKIGETLVKWFGEGRFTIKSERCNQGEGLVKYIGGDAKSAMKCNIIDNFLTRDRTAEKAKKREKSAEPSKIELLKQAVEAGLMTQEQAAEKVLELLK